MNCAFCRRELELGAYVLDVQKSVVGPRGVVALDERTVVCSERCLKEILKKNGHPIQSKVP